MHPCSCLAVGMGEAELNSATALQILQGSVKACSHMLSTLSTQRTAGLLGMSIATW